MFDNKQNQPHTDQDDEYCCQESISKFNTQLSVSKQNKMEVGLEEEETKPNFTSSSMSVFLTPLILHSEQDHFNFNDTCGINDTHCGIMLGP